MDMEQVGILEEAHQIVLSNLLQYLDGIHLKMEVGAPCA